MEQLTFLLPGLSDGPLNDLQGLTPLQKADTPTLDAMQRTTVIPPESGGFETALLWLLDAQPSEDVSLGPLEAAALGFRLAPHQIAYRLRLISAGEGAIVDVSDGLLSDAEGKSFCRAINAAFGREGIHVVHASGPNGVWITTRPEFVEMHAGMNPITLEGVPWKELFPLPDLADRMEALLTEHPINELRIDLEERPVNGILLSEGGTLTQWELEAAGKRVVASSPLFRGVARTAGVRLTIPPTEKRRLDALPWMLEQIKCSMDHTLLVEVPYLWQSTYEGNLREKVKTIEFLDKNLIAPAQTFAEHVTVHPLRHTDITLGRTLPGPIEVFETLP
jgi:2,3-bisphosphoglycerate-independent phosphoglycerate mutase